MEKYFSHAFRGFKPDEVDKLIKRLDIEYQDGIRRLEDELKNIISEIGMLKNEIDVYRRKTDYIELFKKELGEVLSKAHMEASNNVLSSNKSISEMEQKKLEEVEIYEDKYNSLQETQKHIVQDLREKVNQFKSRLEV